MIWAGMKQNYPLVGAPTTLTLATAAQVFTVNEFGFETAVSGALKHKYAFIDLPRAGYPYLC